MMKYTLHIAFDKQIGDILLRVREYANKYGKNTAKFMNPLRFDISDSNVIEVKAPKKNCPVADIALFAMELYMGIPIMWTTNGASQTLQNEKDIEEFFEREFSDKITEEKNHDEINIYIEDNVKEID